MQFEGGRHGVEGGDHDSGFFFAFGSPGMGDGGDGAREPGRQRFVALLYGWKKLGMQFSFAVVKSSVKEYASIGS